MSDFCPICNRPLCRTALGDSTDYEQRAKCYQLGYVRERVAVEGLTHLAAEQAAIIREVRDRGDAELANAVLRANGRESARREKAEAENSRLRDELNELREAKEAAYSQIYKMLATLEGCDDALARFQGHGCLPSDESIATLRRNIRAVAQRDPVDPADVLSAADEIGDEAARTDEPF